MKKIIFILLLFPLISFAQELNAKVTVNFEQLQNDQQDKIKNFGQEVEDYLNNTQFTGDTWGWDKIDCKFSIFFTSGSGTSYSAQVVIISQRSIEGSDSKSLMMNVLDPNWNFTYEEGQAIAFKQTDFDPFLSFLDFYAYVIIALDNNSYQMESGTDMLSNALEIAVRGASSRNSKGWDYKLTAYNKQAFIQEALNANYKLFWDDFYNYHYNGLDIYYRDKATAQKNIVKLINDLASHMNRFNPRSVLLKVFFDAKAGELVNLLKDYPDKSIFNTLIKIDNTHITKYEEALTNY